MNKKIHQDVWVGCICLIFVAFFYSLTLKMPKQPAIYPKAMLTVMGVLSAILLINGVIKTTKGDNEPLIVWDEVKFSLLVFLILALFVIAIHYMGFLIPTMAVMFGLLYVFKIRDWKLLIVYPAILFTVVYIVFALILHVNLKLLG